MSQLLAQRGAAGKERHAGEELVSPTMKDIGHRKNGMGGGGVRTGAAGRKEQSLCRTSR
jgi:hypothetical protein